MKPILAARPPLDASVEERIRASETEAEALAARLQHDREAPAREQARRDAALESAAHSLRRIADALTVIAEKLPPDPRRHPA